MYPQIQTKVTLKLQMKIQDPPQFLYHIQLQPQLQVINIDWSTAGIFALPLLLLFQSMVYIKEIFVHQNCH